MITHNTNNIGKTLSQTGLSLISRCYVLVNMWALQKSVRPRQTTTHWDIILSSTVMSRLAPAGRLPTKRDPLITAENCHKNTNITNTMWNTFTQWTRFEMTLFQHFTHTTTSTTLNDQSVSNQSLVKCQQMAIFKVSKNTKSVLHYADYRAVR